MSNRLCVALGRLTRVMLVATVAWSCSESTSEPGTEQRRTAANVAVSPVNVSIVVGETSPVSATARDANGAEITNPKVTWRSHTPTVATVDANGLVTGIAKGSATITATIDSQNAHVAVFVRMPIADMTISSSAFAAAIGEPHTIEVRPFDANNVLIPGVHVSWTSSAPNVASVAGGTGTTAIVNALSQGTTTITASADGKSVSTTVTVGSVATMDGLWDFNVSGTGASPTCADTGTILFAQTGVLLSGRAQHVSRCVVGSNIQVIGRSPTVVTPASLNANQLRFTLLSTAPSYSCQYTGQLNDDRTAMGGTVTCGALSGTWSAVRASAITSVVIEGDVPIDTMLIGASVNARAKIFTSSGQVFLRSVTWSTTNAQVVSTNVFANDPYAVVVGAIAGGAAVLSAQVENVTASKPVTVHTIQFDNVLVSVDRSCGTSTLGHVYCWTSGAPYRHFTSPALTSLTVGTRQICGLNTAGIAHCWNQEDPLPPNGILTAVNTSLRFARISAGGYKYVYYYEYSDDFVCGLSTDGAAFCWGTNSYGQLGTGGTHAGYSAPAPVATSQRFSALSTGEYGTCAISLAGSAYCWGTGAVLGDGSFQRLVPTPVATATTFDSIYVGGGHSCALTSQGAAWCWGSNGSGEVDPTMQSVPTPRNVSQGRSYRSLALGSSFTCGLSVEGDVYCWGSNSVGQLGQGFTSPPRATPLKINTTQKFTSIASGPTANHTCGVSTNQRVYCWGSYTRLGVPGNSSYAPIAVAGQN